ncbi:hypothetical protein BCF59_0645 [Mycoplasmopsis mustelae]|uniref:YlxR domain-containing protein n=2 Tax=Mycoplasmopsis mustelae TaxID=171289 RepID=A0A4V6Q6B5_9BACT|nr:hypothetical protein BCF59_0645 [Mycoplasmopsis mustelae]
MNEKTKNYTRKCIATNQILDAKKLTRIDFDKKKNQLTLDINKTLKGRGAYFLCNLDNWNKITKTKALNRTFRTNITKEMYDNLQTAIMEVIYGQKE